MVMACAMCCIITVLPDLGLATIRPRWPMPMGAKTSRMRPVRFSSLLMSRSRRMVRFGCSGVRFSNMMRCLIASGATPLTLSTFTRAK
ncbi:hypothetical protein D3C85_1079430 [compost metagenome]